MSEIHNPVDAIRHNNETRAAIPTTELAGTENVADEKNATYQTFKNDFNRGRDPELYWLGKYRNDYEETQRPDLKVDIRSLYVHEDIKPEMLINSLYRIEEQRNSEKQYSLLDSDDFDVHTTVEEEIQKVAEYYQHTDKWKNRLIQGDSLLVMNSLLKREGMAGKVQCIYIDPPYGIKYGSNWQMKLNSRDVKDNDENLTGEPEMIKAFRDTWELGIHSYLTYLRDRLVLARELLTQSGSVFVQISDENVHLVRNILDEVFGSENFMSQIVYKKTSGAGSPGELTTPASVSDYIIWYAKDFENVKYRRLYLNRGYGDNGSEQYDKLELSNGERTTIKDWEKNNGLKFDLNTKPNNCKLFRYDNFTCQSGGENARFPITIGGKEYKINHGSWKTNKSGVERLLKLNRLAGSSKGAVSYVRFLDDFPYMMVTNLWEDTTTGGDNKIYVVQTTNKAIQRCILMTTDPGDLVLDPTCGSGTTAYVAEQWGRRWITMDTSRIALNIAKKRLTTATFPYYELFDKESKDIRQGFVYKTVPHITLKSLANNEPAEEEILYDQPKEDKKRLRVSGPFTVETLQSYNIIAPEELEEQRPDEAEENRLFQQRIFDHLQASGIRNGDKQQQAKFHSIESVANPYLNARGWYTDANGSERLAYFHIGPKFGTVSKQAVAKATQEMLTNKAREGASWLVILGFSFEDNIITNDVDTKRFGVFTISKVRMHDDLMQDGLLKKDKGAGSFITIGEPDIELVKDSQTSCHVEIKGLDIYDPIRDDVRARSVDDIAYWEMDDNYKVVSQFGEEATKVIEIL